MVCPNRSLKRDKSIVEALGGYNTLQSPIKTKREMKKADTMSISKLKEEV
jgi:hypothetical protein